MATNRKRADGYHLPLTVTDPATPASGDPVRFGALTGVALVDEGEGGNATGQTSVDLSPSVWLMSVKAVNDAGNSAVVAGDLLFYVDGDTPKLSKKNSGYFFGTALEGVTSGATASIQVLHDPGPGNGGLGAGTVAEANIADGAVATAKVADGAVTRAKLAENVLQPHAIRYSDVRGADGAALAITETAGDFYLDIGTNQMRILGEISNGTVGADTEASVGWFEFTLPANYVDAGDVRIRSGVDVIGAGALGTCTIDFEARLADPLEATVGADLVTTAATAISKTAANKDFVVNAAGLVSGDRLVCKMTTSVDNTDSTAIQAQISKLQMLCDVK